MRRSKSQLLLVAGLLCFASIAGPAAAGGDADAGRIKSEACLGCHGIESYRNAYPSYRVPRIGGQKASYLEAALKAYRSGDRAHATMRAQAASLSDEDISDIAVYFAGSME